VAYQFITARTTVMMMVCNTMTDHTGR